MIVDVEAERSIEVIFYKLTQAGLSMHVAFRGTDDVIAIREKTGVIGRGVGDDVEDVPDVFGDG